MVIAIENTPHGLSARALTTTRASTASRMTMIDEHADDRGDAADRAQFVARHLAERAAAPPDRDRQHQVVLDAPGEHGADDDPDGARQVAHLHGQHRADQRTGAGDRGEVMAEQHPPVGRHVVGAVLEQLGGRGVVVAGRTIFISMSRA